MTTDFGKMSNDSFPPFSLQNSHPKIPSRRHIHTAICWGQGGVIPKLHSLGPRQNLYLTRGLARLPFLTPPGENQSLHLLGSAPDSPL